MSIGSCSGLGFGVGGGFRLEQCGVARDQVPRFAGEARPRGCFCSLARALGLTYLAYPARQAGGAWWVDEQAFADFAKRAIAGGVEVKGSGGVGGGMEVREFGGIEMRGSEVGQGRGCESAVRHSLRGEGEEKCVVAGGAVEI